VRVSIGTRDASKNGSDSPSQARRHAAGVQLLRVRLLDDALALRAEQLPLEPVELMLQRFDDLCLRANQLDQLRAVQCCQFIGITQAFGDRMLHDQIVASAVRAMHDFAQRNGENVCVVAPVQYLRAAASNSSNPFPACALQTSSQ
jgi:hypothetical protein